MQRDIFYVSPVGTDFEVIGRPENYHMRNGSPRRIAFCTHKSDADAIVEALNMMERAGWSDPNKHTGTNEERLERGLPAFKKAAGEYTAKATKTPESARKALVDSGIYTQNGELSEHYRTQNTYAEQQTIVTRNEHPRPSGSLNKRPSKT